VGTGAKPSQTNERPIPCRAGKTVHLAHRIPVQIEMKVFLRFRKKQPVGRKLANA